MKDVRITVRMTPEEHEMLKILVIKKKMTINEFLLQFIREEIVKNERENKKN